jgi:hypothetical protein
VATQVQEKTKIDRAKLEKTSASTPEETEPQEANQSDV